MYAYTAPAGLLKDDDQVDFSEKILDEDGQYLPGINDDFCYWRKLNSLHGWMEQLYYAKGGKSDSFNGDVVRLKEADIEALETAIEDKTLVRCQGFFFGDSEGEVTDDEYGEITAFCEKARLAFELELAVIYSSCW